MKKPKSIACDFCQLPYAQRERVAGVKACDKGSYRYACLVVPAKKK